MIDIDKDKDVNLQGLPLAIIVSPGALNAEICTRF
jgi:hypothetical protein